MTLTFDLRTEKGRQPWKTIDSLDISEKRKEWQPGYSNYEISYMKERIKGDELDQYQKSNENFIHIIKKYCERTISGMYKNVLFIFTSPKGIVQSVSGPLELIKSLDHNHNLGVGTVFTIQNAGLNSINISIELKDWVFLSGQEHDLKLFKEWNCFCSPVRKNGEIIGYLDMSFSVDEDHLLMAPLFELTLLSIKEELEKYDYQAAAYEQFKSYKLSPREKEVSSMWMKNYSALRIAAELGIAEGTVRNVIKKIYRKTGVSDKGQFIRKFIRNYSIGFIHPILHDYVPQFVYHLP